MGGAGERAPAARPGLRVVGPPAILSLDLDGAARGGAPVLGPLRLEVGRGETLAVTGPSGIGKTTLLRVMAGLDAARGRVSLPARRALVFQEPTLLPWRTARANLVIAARVSPDAAEAWLERVGLGGLGDRHPGHLSLGQQRRLGLARAFASEPDLMLMDEPFVSLDPESAEAMMDLFARLRRASGVATVLVTHSEAEARRLASRIVRLGGRPAGIVEDAQNAGRSRHPSASGTASSGP